MSDLNNDDIRALQQASSLAAELFAQRAKLIGDFQASLAAIDDRIGGALGAAFGPSALPTSQHAQQENSQSTSALRTPRVRSNPHPLPWFILVAMRDTQESAMSDDTIAKKVLEMSYRTNASNFRNSIYTRLFALQRSGLVKKSTTNGNMWSLTAKGVKQAEKNSAQRKREE
jgi:hypothetical protein